MLDLLGEIDFGESIADSFSAHFGSESLGAVGFAGFTIFVFAQKLVLLERSGASVDDHVVLVVDDALEIPSGHVEDQADAGWHALEEPDMANRHGQFDV